MTFSFKSPAFILSILVVIALLVGVIVFLQYLNQPQDTRSQAAVPGGTAEVGFKQPSLALDAGEDGLVTVVFNTKNSRISAVGVRITFAYTGTTPPLTASDIKVNPVLQNSNFNCPTNSFIPGSGTATIEFGCVVVQGYTNNTNVDLFSFQLSAADDIPAQTATLSFASAQTTIFEKETGADVAAIPRGTLAVSIAGAATPEPTATPTATPSATPTATPTPTPTPALISCNGACTANRDCADNLSCINGKCLDYRCSADTTCQCQTTQVATTSTLPQSGFDQTLTMFMLGMLFLLGGGQLLYTFAWRETEQSERTEN